MRRGSGPPARGPDPGGHAASSGRPVLATVIRRGAWPSAAGPVKDASLPAGAAARRLDPGTGRAAWRPVTRRPAPPLPARLAQAHDGFVRHLSLELGGRRTPSVPTPVTWPLCSTTRARMGVTAVDELELAVLRSWLARLRATGAARTTLARRGSSARTFTAWVHRRGLAPTDPGRLLATPKGHRPLPDVLRPDEADRLVEAVDGERPRVAARPGGARAALRDGDPGRRALRARRRRRRPEPARPCASSAREARSGRCPTAPPAERAVDAWLTRGRPRWATATSGPRAPARTPRRTCRPACGARAGAPPAGRRAGRPGPRSRTDSGTARRPTCSRAAPTCAASRSCWATPASRRRRSTPTSAWERLRASYAKAHPRA
jgi:integrase/recombinase XerC